MTPAKTKDESRPDVLASEGSAVRTFHGGDRVIRAVEAPDGGRAHQATTTETDAEVDHADTPAGDGTGSGELVADVWDVLADTQAEAANLKARAALLAALLVQVRGWDVTQGEAARRLGLTRPRLNDLLRGKLHKFSLDALVNLLPAAGLELDLGRAIRTAA